MLADLIFNLCVGLIAALTLRRTSAPTRRAVALLVVSLALAVIGGRLFGRIFLPLRLLAFTIFLHAPLLLGWLAWRQRRLWPALLAMAALLVGIDAFLVEPRALQASVVTVRSPRLTQRWRVALVADLQTDRIGAHEREALRRTMAWEPDLVLFAGDYLQIHDDAEWERGVPDVVRLLREAGFDGPDAPPAYAVQGNMEWRDTWPRLFEGTRVVPVRETTTFDHGELAITALSFAASFGREPLPAPEDAFQIVFGHGPDFALNSPPGQLLLAGHTHGGQVRLPWIGPLITFSRVPRAWASGLTRLGPEQTLYVSRGIGLERGDAPRLRFNCLPELVLFELEPGEASVERRAGPPGPRAAPPARATPASAREKRSDEGPATEGETTAAEALPAMVEGWLADARRVGRACERDQDCGRWERCRVGLCMNRGAACDADEDCGLDARCDEGFCASGARACGPGAPCAEGGHCLVGVCWDGADIACERDADCGAGRRCFLGDCIEGVRDCTADGDCEAEQRCEFDRCSEGARQCVTDADCGDDARCLFGSCAEGTRSCDADADCPAHHACSYGVCAPEVP